MMMVMMMMVLMSIMAPMGTCLTCPSSCSSSISPVPYPFGAAAGCGAPGFQISNCTINPQWDLQVSGTSHIYYIRSINQNPNSSSSNSSYGYSGSIILSLSPSPSPTASFCDINTSYSYDAFTSLNLYAFQGANLSFYQDYYLLLNCTSSSPSPSSGILIPSSASCIKFLSQCNLNTSSSCLEYTPDKVLEFGTILTTYNCTHLKRFIIDHEDDPTSKWVTGIQLAWGSVNDAASCSGCQSTGGTCGYNTQDNSFLCYCGSETYQTDCDQKSGTGRNTTKGIVAGVSCAFAVLLILACIAFFYWYKYCYWRVLRYHKHRKLYDIHQTPIEFPYGALASATKFFSTKIGQGGVGKVYKGLLLDGDEVAVKVLDSSASQTDEHFLNEVATIGNIHHMNVARLFGFCFRRSKRILVYEYVSNGSLDKYLFSAGQSSDVAVLNWKQRYNIALGIARGLSYMHEECRKCIIHCDIKPQNILLDVAFCPKISDFGLAKLLTREESRILTRARGTPGYVAPEFWSLGSGPLTAKFDVYSYGVVLLEIIQGKRSFHQLDPFYQEELEEELDEGLSVSIDERIVNDADLEQVRTCTLVALWCIQEDPSLRPTMSRVVQFLQGTAPVPANPPRPFRNMERHEQG